MGFCSVGDRSWCGRGLAERSRLAAVLDPFVGRREAAGEYYPSPAWWTANPGVASRDGDAPAMPAPILPPRRGRMRPMARVSTFSSRGRASPSRERTKAKPADIRGDLQPNANRRLATPSAPKKKRLAHRET
jgi:hypothetical protein